MGPAQLADVLRQIPPSNNPDLLVGFETSDDAGVFLVSPQRALVQTVDFFTPIVDDPYSFGQIAAANSLSDIYAMGGRPLTALNISLFDPEVVGTDAWAQVLLGAFDKCREAGAVVIGGHSVKDREPKFGLSVTGEVDPSRIFSNRNAEPGQTIYLTKPLGTGIITTAAKFDRCPPDVLANAIQSMSMLNADAKDRAHQVGCRCATDITGFGLLGHLFNIARGSKVRIEVNLSQIPLLPGVQQLIAENQTFGAEMNRRHLEPYIERHGPCDELLEAVAFDPQTSGGLAILSVVPIPGATPIGRIAESTERFGISLRT